MPLLYLILFVVALVLFVLVAFGVTARRVNLLALGLALWVLVSVLQAFLHV